MKHRPTLIVAASLVTMVTGCNPDTDVQAGSAAAASSSSSGAAASAGVVEMMTIAGHHKDLDCEGVEEYCGGWTIYESPIPYAKHHALKRDTFVIGRKNTGTTKLYLFPRADLYTRWNKKKVELTKIESGGTVECLVATVKLDKHRPPGGGPEEDHPDSTHWHAVVIRNKEGTPDYEIGQEGLLEMCFVPRDDGSTPDACLECPEDPEDPGQHGGRAHSYD